MTNDLSKPECMWTLPSDGLRISPDESQDARCVSEPLAPRDKTRSQRIEVGLVNNVYPKRVSGYPD